MPEIRVQDEQGNIHVFPDGSTPGMISQALGVTQPVAKAPLPEPVGLSNLRYGPALREVALGAMGTVAPEASPKTLGNVGALAKGLAETFGAPRSALGALAGPMLPAVRMASSVGRSLLGGVEESGPLLGKLTPGGGFGATVTQEELNRGAHGLGTLGGLGLMGTLALRKPALKKPGFLEESTIGDRVHSAGLGVQTAIRRADHVAEMNVDALMDNVAKAVDQKYPHGAIDAAKHVEIGRKAWDEMVKKREKIPQEQMAGINEVISRTPEATPGRWGFEQAKQLRSRIGEAIRSERYTGPIKSVLSESYRRLTDDLKAVADSSGVLEDFKRAEQTHKNLMRMREGLLNKVYSTPSGTEVFKRLYKDPALTREYLKNLRDYGLPAGEVWDVTRAAKAGTEGGPLGKWWTRYAGGGAAHYILGAPWILGAFGGGISEALLKSARLGRIGETPFAEAGRAMLRERSLPGVTEPTSVPPPVPPRPSEPSPITSPITPEAESKPLSSGKQATSKQAPGHKLPSGPSPDVLLEEIALSVAEAARLLGRVGGREDPSRSVPSQEGLDLAKAAKKVQQRARVAKLRTAKRGGSVY